MANAYKCDICGGYYDSNDWDKTPNGYKDRKFAIAVKQTISNDNVYKQAGSRIDICTDCYNKLVDFIGWKQLWLLKKYLTITQN